MTRNRLQYVLPCAVGCLLSACASLLPAPGEPTKKYTLDALFSEGSGGSGFSPSHHLVVDTPTVYSPVDTTRIALKPEAQTIDYYADVEWADRLSTLIQESVIYTFQNRGALRGVGRPTEGIQADYALKLEVRKFYIEQNGLAHASMAHVDCIAYLVKLPERHVTASRRFTQTQVASEQAIDSIIKSLNLAWQDVSKALVPWVLGHAR